jgi:hypothetical protein
MTTFVAKNQYCGIRIRLTFCYPFFAEKFYAYLKKYMLVNFYSCFKRHFSITHIITYISDKKLNKQCLHLFQKGHLFSKNQCCGIRIRSDPDLFWLLLKLTYCYMVSFFVLFLCILKYIFVNFYGCFKGHFPGTNIISYNIYRKKLNLRCHIIIGDPFLVRILLYFLQQTWRKLKDDDICFKRPIFSTNFISFLAKS